jgi:hypothetical protein
MTPEQIAALEGLLKYYDKTTAPSEVQKLWKQVQLMVKEAKKAEPAGDGK